MEEPEAKKPRKEDGAPLDDLLECGVCLGTMVSASELPCGHAFCEECVKTAVSNQGACPLCRQSHTPIDITPNRYLERLAAPRVKNCRYEPCAFKGKRDELLAHEAACEHQPVAAVLDRQRGELAALRAAFEEERNQWLAEKAELERSLADARLQLESARAGENADNAKLKIDRDANHKMLLKRAGCRWGELVPCEPGEHTGSRVIWTEVGDSYETIFKIAKDSSTVKVVVKRTAAAKSGILEDREWTVRVVDPRNVAADVDLVISCPKHVMPGTEWDCGAEVTLKEIQDRSLNGFFVVGHR